MHTNDELLTCGTPTFGRNAQDRIESGNGYRSGGGGCGGSPDFQGTLVPDAGTIGMPATNATLATIAAADPTLEPRTPPTVTAAPSVYPD